MNFSIEIINFVISSFSSRVLKYLMKEVGFKGPWRYYLNKLNTVTFILNMSILLKPCSCRDLSWFLIQRRSFIRKLESLYIEFWGIYDRLHFHCYILCIQCNTTIFTVNVSQKMREIYAKKAKALHAISQSYDFTLFLKCGRDLLNGESDNCDSMY